MSIIKVIPRKCPFCYDIMLYIDDNNNIVLYCKSCIKYCPNCLCSTPEIRKDDNNIYYARCNNCKEIWSSIRSFSVL